MTTVSIDLSKMPLAYTKQPRRMEIMAGDREFDEPGEIPTIFLQEVEGCGYTVFPLSPDEAMKIGKALVAAAKKYGAK